VHIKECFETEGEPWSAGVRTRVGLLGVNSCTAVQRLEAAGGIVLGKGNTSENCMWLETDNTVYGRTNNPYDLSRSPGGSSGGEAAVVSSLGAPLALGSDVGGSIRIPAYYTGLFGHKPTGGTVPNTHTWPTCHGEHQRYCQLGPIARCAEDLMPLLRVVAGPDGKDGRCQSLAFGDPAAVDLTKLTVLNCEDLSGGSWLVRSRHPELIEAHRKVTLSPRPPPLLHRTPPGDALPAHPPF
jgi:fatty acid amide hydrolase 2